MYYHVVLFKLKENTPESRKKAKALLCSMEGNIPMLRSVLVGEDELGTPRSMDLCLITTFDSQADMEAYQVHPHHVDVVLKELRPMLADSRASDFTHL